MLHLTSEFTMDVVCHDDLMRLRTGHGAQNMAIIRHTAMNTIELMPGKYQRKTKESMVWNTQKLKNALTANQ